MRLDFKTIPSTVTVMRSLVFVVAFFVMTNCAQATVYFQFDAESGTVGNTIPNPPFCNNECGADVVPDPLYGNSGGAPQGSKYFYWNIASLQHDHYNEVKASTGQLGAVGSGLPHTFAEGSTVYLAYWLRLDRVGSVPRFNVFEVGSGIQSAEKGIGIHGPNISDGLRWDSSIGQWDSYSSNSANHFTIFGGNPSHHLNPSLEHNDVFWQNQNGYSNTNPIQLAYET